MTAILSFALDLSARITKTRSRFRYIRLAPGLSYGQIGVIESCIHELLGSTMHINYNHSKYSLHELCQFPRELVHSCRQTVTVVAPPDRRRHFENIKETTLTCVENMQFVDYSFVTTTKYDHQFFDCHRPMAMTRPRTGSRSVCYPLPLQYGSSHFENLHVENRQWRR
jgi:hypothetical protein